MPETIINQTNINNYGKDFLLEEYRIIASTHDRMRDVINRMFYYFLLLSAIPFTVATLVYRDSKFNLTEIPLSIGLLFLIISLSILFLSLASVAARYRQNTYAHTVNRIRAYFADNHLEIKQYLYLPITDAEPRSDDLGHVLYYIISMALVGGLYFFLGIVSLTGFNIFLGLATFSIYVLVLIFLPRLIFRKHYK
jgi:hypothetical protein